MEIIYLLIAIVCLLGAFITACCDFVDRTTYHSETLDQFTDYFSSKYQK